MTSPRLRLVFDTNVLVSGALFPGSTPFRALEAAVREGLLVVSPNTLMEIHEVLGRAKFDRYISREDRQQFLRLLGGVAEIVNVIAPIHACRDPKDDRFLEAAFYGRAETIVTGDRDLLALNPFRGIRVLTPSAFLRRSS
jgi:uncharacterized protein